MNKVIILSNINKFSYHEQIIKALKNTASPVLSGALITDISDKSNFSSVSDKLSSECPDIIITLDLAGFELRTLTGECLLNMLPCKVCNIIWGNKPEYNAFLNGKISLSMIFYDATGQDNHLLSAYPNMHYYYSTDKPVSTIPSGILDDVTVNVLQEILTHFKNEVLL